MVRSCALAAAWLYWSHRKLDQAVFTADSWPDDEILSSLLALNLQCSRA